MASNYPGGMDEFETIATDTQMSTTVGGRTHRDMHNDLGDAVESIEGELGLNPAGIYDTVAERLAAVDDRVLDGTISDIDIAAEADIARTKIAGTALTADSMGVFNVKDYGAAGDDTADDTAELQAAITAAAAAGGTVLVPPGTYKITDALTVTGAATITGTGTIHQVTSGKHGFNVSASGVTIDGLTLTGRNTTAVYTDSENAVHAFGPSAAAAISNLTFRNLTISGWGDYGVQLKYVTDYQVIGCTISDVGYAGVSTLSALRGVIADNRIDSIEPGFVGDCYGIALSREEVDSLVTDPHSSDTVVRGNIISNIAWEGLDTHGGQRITFSDNVIRNCGRGIMVGGSEGANQVGYWGPKDCIVSGNVIDSQVTDGSAKPGIAFTGIAGATADDPAVDYGTGAIVGNVIRGHGIQNDLEGAIYCRNTEGLVISGNTIEEPSCYGICMYYDNRAFSIVGNVIVDVWSTASSNPTALAFLSSNNIGGVVSGNVLRDGAKTAAHLNATGIRAHATTSVRYGLNDFRAATYPTYDRVGISETFEAPLTLGYGVHITADTSDGNKIGTDVGQKLGFWNATPVVQPAANADTSGASLGDLETEVNQLKALLRSIGLMAT